MNKIDAGEIIRKAEFHRKLASQYRKDANELLKIEDPTDAQRGLWRYSVGQVMHHKAAVRKALKNEG